MNECKYYMDCNKEGIQVCSICDKYACQIHITYCHKCKMNICKNRQNELCVDNHNNNCINWIKIDQLNKRIDKLEEMINTMNNIKGSLTD